MANRRLACHHADALIPAPGGPPQALWCRSGVSGAGRHAPPWLRAARLVVCGCGFRKAWGLNQVSICRPGVNYVSPSQSLPLGAGVEDGPGGANALSDCSWRDVLVGRGNSLGALCFSGLTVADVGAERQRGGGGAAGRFPGSGGDHRSL